jgi:hypothetical protein
VQEQLGEPALPAQGTNATASASNFWRGSCAGTS